MVEEGEALTLTPHANFHGGRKTLLYIVTTRYSQQLIHIVC